MTALPYLAARENAAMWRSIGQHYRAEEWERRADAMIPKPPKPPKPPAVHVDRTARARAAVLSALQSASLTTAEVASIINLSRVRTIVILWDMERDGSVNCRRTILRKHDGAVVNIWSVKEEGAA